MKKNNKLLVSILSIIVAAILFSVPLTFFMDSVASASDSAMNIEGTSDFSKSASGEDYVFVVIDDEPTALAATPFQSKNIPLVFLTVCSSLIAMIAVSYVFWYTMVRRNIYNYSRIIPDYEIRSLIPAKAFVHPFELSAAEIEVQYRAANRYI